MEKMCYLAIGLLLSCPQVLPGETKTTHIDNEGLTSNNESTTSHYQDVIGEWYGFSRELISINGEIGLIALGRGEYYFTLTTQKNRTLIDCIYVNERNKQNGAGISVGLCNSNLNLDQTYIEAAQYQSNIFGESIYSFDTSPVSRGLKSKFLLGKIGKVEIYDSYESENDLMKSSPRKYIRSADGCLSMKDTTAFLVFMAPNNTTPSYLDVVTSHSPMTIKRFDESDLIKMATEKCG